MQEKQFCKKGYVFIERSCLSIYWWWEGGRLAPKFYAMLKHSVGVSFS